MSETYIHLDELGDFIAALKQVAASGPGDAQVLENAHPGDETRRLKTVLTNEFSDGQTWISINSSTPMTSAPTHVAEVHTQAAPKAKTETPDEK